MPAMVLAALAAGLLEIRFALLAKGSRPAFAREFELVKPPLQAVNLLLLLPNDLQQRSAGGQSGLISGTSTILFDSPQIRQGQFLGRQTSTINAAFVEKLGVGK